MVHVFATERELQQRRPKLQYERFSEFFPFPDFHVSLLPKRQMQKFKEIKCLTVKWRTRMTDSHRASKVENIRETDKDTTDKTMQPDRWKVTE